MKYARASEREQQLLKELLMERGFGINPLAVCEVSIDENGHRHIALADIYAMSEGEVRKFTQEFEKRAKL